MNYLKNMIKKQKANAIMFPASSDNASLTYKYIITDIDNSIFADTDGRRFFYNFYGNSAMLSVDKPELIVSNDTTKATIENNKVKKNIFFFEEGMKTGGIAEHFMMKLYSTGYRGNYHITAPEGFIKQASVKSQLKKYCLDHDGMINTVRNNLYGDENDA